MATVIVSGIYIIRNTISDRVYVGSAVNLRLRWAQHKSGLRGGYHHSKALQRAWTKYGEDAFKFEVIELVEDINHLIAREQHWIDAHKPTHGKGYNICPTAGSRLGSAHSEEVRAKMGKRRLGKKHTQETRQRMSEARLAQKIVMSDETKQKLRDTNLGKKLSDEVKAKLSARFKGSLRPEISAACTGRKRSPETIAKAAHGRRLFYIRKRAESEADQGTLRL